jgi:hypothetical protein
MFLTITAEAENTPGRATMNHLRKQAQHSGLPVAYADDVSEETVRELDKRLREQFRDADWVTVEQES